MWLSRRWRRHREARGPRRQQTKLARPATKARMNTSRVSSVCGNPTFQFWDAGGEVAHPHSQRETPYSFGSRYRPRGIQPNRPMEAAAVEPTRVAVM